MSAPLAINRQPTPSDDAPSARRRLVLGVPVDNVDMAHALVWIERSIAAARAVGEGFVTRQVVTLNPEIVMAARANPALCAAIATADLVLPDGAGVVWAAGLHARVTGIDLLEALAGLAARRGYRLFLLGAAPGVGTAAADALRARYPGLAIAGTEAGSPGPAERSALAARIHATQADVVFVAFGAPAQEEWIAATRGALGAAVAVGVGGALDFVAGRVPRAPEWMRVRGLEWLFRLLRQPWRWRRMLALPRFAAAVVVSRRAASVGRWKRED
ncbi:MAG TPA: WecB/TagA/CpsF family glycosyltransferase [Ktedonobacterales bacterium]